MPKTLSGILPEAPEGKNVSDTRIDENVTTLTELPPKPKPKRQKGKKHALDSDDEEHE